MNTEMKQLDLTPWCDGAPWQPGLHGTDEAVKEAFVSAYREINERVRELREVRSKPGFSRQAEREALQAVERALLARDAVENKFTPRGWLATPVVRDGLVREILFSPPRQGTEQVSFSMTFVVTPAGEPLARREVQS